MKISQVSTSHISTSLRASVAELQSKYLVAHKESLTLRAADMGLHLGNRTSEVLSLRAQFSQIGSIKQANDSIAIRMDTTQAALTAIVTDAEDFLTQLIPMRDRTIGSDVVQDQAKTRLQALMEILNTGLDGANMFAGINTQNKPIVDYYASPTATNKVGIDAAFSAAFGGLTQDNPAVETIDAATLQTFLDTDFAQKFEEPAWSAEWSDASDAVRYDKISLTERIPTSVSANAEPIRKLVKAYTMIAELGLNNMNDQAYGVIIDEATRLIGEAIPGIATLQAQLGNSQERLEYANNKIDKQIALLNERVGEMEGVDGYEAQVRVNELKTRIETSYELTVRIQSLSLVNYLR
ncbi:Hook-associated protein HAP3 [Candidatus Filomicrobium marinum]|uniref:Flagellin n=1 Tax=Candidatus Filomicrobium marinum TaxID=1608628 RepID=A0A0D6JKD3_9HYPH|nr:MULTISPECIES: flagellar hook-associated family protein [Filomicrobium]MCV0371588.1 flagellar hook-associated family protein [Filomicrobium sp.]CFX54834.1 Hook-associated protein HAP3 [Candidatus Filomicrobium marinum]CPR22162.1 Hook-associated protein HAP3 [Candidatus Filomicrobium marinum]